MTSLSNITSSPHNCLCHHHNNTSTENQLHEQDIIISQLRNRIIELEQVKESTLQLNQTLTAIQQENNALSLEKQHVESEAKKIQEALRRQLNDLQSTNNNLQLVINDKISINKALFKEKDELLKELDAKIDECHSLHNTIDTMTIRLSKQDDNRISHERIIHSLTEIKVNQTNQIAKVLEDNNDLKGIIEGYLKTISAIRNDKDNLMIELNQLNEDYNVMLLKMHSKDEEMKRKEEEIIDIKRIDYMRMDDIHRKDKDVLGRLIVDKENMIIDLRKELDNERGMSKGCYERNVMLEREVEELKKQIGVYNHYNAELKYEMSNIRQKDNIIRKEVAQMEKQRNESMVISHKYFNDRHLSPTYRSNKSFNINHSNSSSKFNDSNHNSQFNHSMIGSQSHRSIGQPYTYIPHHHNYR